MWVFYNAQIELAPTQPYVNVSYGFTKLGHRYCFVPTGCQESDKNIWVTVTGYVFN